jgi:hypothetical protein
VFHSSRPGRETTEPNELTGILNHQSGTISGVAAVYQRHEFLTERKEALDRWGSHVADLMNEPAPAADNDRQRGSW